MIGGQRQWLDEWEFPGAIIDRCRQTIQQLWIDCFAAVLDVVERPNTHANLASDVLPRQPQLEQEMSEVPWYRHHPFASSALTRRGCFL